nr:MAG TPA: hypothetical protein [Caudoviricetes sp.]
MGHPKFICYRSIGERGFILIIQLFNKKGTPNRIIFTNN